MQGCGWDRAIILTFWSPRLSRLLGDHSSPGDPVLLSLFCSSCSFLLSFSLYTPGCVHVFILLCMLSMKFSLFLRFYLFFREREREGEIEGEIHQCMFASRAPPAGDLACNPGMCPDWELNQQPFGLQASTQFIELQGCLCAS